MPDQAPTTFQRHAELSADMLATLEKRLGSDFFTRSADVEFVLTENGHTGIMYDELTFFLNSEGEPIAGRRKSGRAEFAHVTPTGIGEWIRAPVREVGIALTCLDSNALTCSPCRSQNQSGPPERVNATEGPGAADASCDPYGATLRQGAERTGENLV